MVAGDCGRERERDESRVEGERERERESAARRWRERERVMPPWHAWVDACGDTPYPMILRGSRSSRICGRCDDVRIAVSARAAAVVPALEFSTVFYISIGIARLSQSVQAPRCTIQHPAYLHKAKPYIAYSPCTLYHDND